MKYIKDNNDLRIAKIIVERIVNAGVNLTDEYQDWVNCAFSLASLGEDGRELFHHVSAMDGRYDRQQCDEKFTNCLNNKQGVVTIGTLVQIAKDHGVDTSMPKGRPKQTVEDKREAAMSRFLMNQQILLEQGEFRFNTWTKRPEVLEDGVWRPVNERDFETYYCAMAKAGANVNRQTVRSMLYDRNFVLDFDPIKSWLDSLPEWNPDTDPDYIRDFFIGHILFGDPENVEFYDMVFRKWMCNIVALWLGMVEDNPILPVLTGAQHVGKTFLCKNVLPPELRDYLYCANPSARVDKDFIISLSEVALMFLDEFSFGSNAKSDAYKYVVTSGRSNERDSYAMFRERRDRKASLIAATNQKRFIKDAEGNRRYPGINVVGTVNLGQHPLPYEGAYAQALYLVTHNYEFKPTAQESQLITDHNVDYMEPNDCEEALKTYYRKPAHGEVSEARTAGQIMQELSAMGLYGKGYSAVEIGRALKRLGYESYPVHGSNKYVIKKINLDELESLQRTDASDIIEKAGYDDSIYDDNAKPRADDPFGAFEDLL